MPKAKPENCEHPRNKWATSPSYGHTVCTRCDTDLTPGNRRFEFRAGERTTFRQGDRIHVKGTDIMSSYKGTFQWAEVDGDGAATCYCVFEKQTYQPEGSKQWHEGTAAVRFPLPENVRHDDGVRSRRAREEATA